MFTCTPRRSRGDGAGCRARRETPPPPGGEPSLDLRQASRQRTSAMSKPPLSDHWGEWFQRPLRAPSATSARRPAAPCPWHAAASTHCLPHIAHRPGRRGPVLAEQRSVPAGTRRQVLSTRHSSPDRRPQPTPAEQRSVAGGARRLAPLPSGRPPAPDRADAAVIGAGPSLRHAPSSGAEGSGTCPLPLRGAGRP
jgi:hypothetical protein